MEDNATTADENNSGEQNSQATADNQTIDNDNNLGDTTSNSGSGTSESVSFDEDLDAWAEKTNRPKPENDEDRKRYQDERNSQREFTKERQAQKAADGFKSKLENIKPTSNDNKNDDGDLRAELENFKKVYQEEKMERRREQFLSNLPDDEIDMMGTLIQERVAKQTTQSSKEKAFGLWSDPDMFPELLLVAKAKLKESSAEAEAEKIRNEESERIAKESTAGRHSRNVTSYSENKGETRADRLRKFFS